MSVPCYGDCGPDDAWVAAQLAGKRATEKKNEQNARENVALKRLLKTGVAPAEAARLPSPILEREGIKVTEASFIKCIF